MKSFLNAKVRLAFGFAMLTLLLMGALSYRWMTVSDESDHWGPLICANQIICLEFQLLLGIICQEFHYYSPIFVHRYQNREALSRL